MSTSPRFLIVEDSDDDAELLLRELHRGGIKPTFERVDSAAGVKDAMKTAPSTSSFPTTICRGSRFRRFCRR